jgi:uncharacterized protein YfaS (alpha-2-macroglobulin family)
MRASGLALLALAFACGGKKSSAPPPSDGSGSATVAIDPKDQLEGLVLRVSHGKQGVPAFDRAKLAPATKLPDAEVAAMVAKMPPLAIDPADTQAFALRPASTPPPTTGDTIKTAFPPPPGGPPPASVAGKPLTVSRFAPEGEVPEAASLSVTFSQPMVAVTSQTAAAQTVPVKILPTPKGNWRWIGTRTIVFDADPRFPHATTYRVEVPAGAKSATGETLAKPATFMFETPAPRIVEHYPSDNRDQRTNVPILIVFDQKIDPAAMLAAIRVNAVARAKPEAKAVPVTIRVVDAKEIAAEKDERFMAAVAALEAAQTGRWIAIRATQALPADSEIVVELPPGAPSLEGPNKTKKAESFSFLTYPAFAIDRTSCEREPCPAGWTSLYIGFTTDLDHDAFDPKLVTMTPPIPDAEITVYGSSIQIAGTTVAQTKYNVTIGKGLKDDSGQTLGKDETRTLPIGDAREVFDGPNRLVVVDPALATPALEVFTTNHPELKVKLYKVGPADFPAFEAFYLERWGRRPDPGRAMKAPGKLVSDVIVKTTAGANKLVETKLDLTAALGGKRGHIVAVIEPHPWDPAKYRNREVPRAISWVQVTKLAVDVHVDGENLVGFASDLATGAPIGGVELELRPAGKKITTDTQGLATLSLPPGEKVDAFVIARRGEDVTILDGGDWSKKARESELVWYVSDDRAMYRPGETVSMKGWLRARDHGKGGDLAVPAIQRLTYVATDVQDVKLATGTVPVDALGGFDLKLVLPKTPNLGFANIRFLAPGVGSDTDHDHRFQIQEFRRPEFEVSAVASPGPFIVGGSADITVSAKYYAGGPLPGARTRWRVAASETTFSPPNQTGYAFGSFGRYDRMRSIASPRFGRHARQQELEAKTDGSGAHTMHVDFVSVKPNVPMTVIAIAEVEDVNRQEWSAQTTFIVHPASLYVGLRPLKPFVSKGTPIDVEMIGVDLDGKTVAGARIDVQAVRLEGEFKRGEYTEKEVDPQACKAVSAAVPARCKFQTPVGGRYLVTATITDDKGRKHQAQSLVWVSGGEPRPARSIEHGTIEVVPDKAEYAPGTTAEILVASPFYPAEGIVTWQRNGIIKTERITMTGPTAIVKVPITDAMVPGLTVQVDLAGAEARVDNAGNPDPKQPKRPAYAVGSVLLEVPPVQRKLAITVTPSASKLAPGERGSIAIAVTDAAGKPVAGAQAAVFVVDEAILALSDHTFEDPLDAFYEQLSSGTSSSYVRSKLSLATLADAKQAASGRAPPMPSRRYATIGRDDVWMGPFVQNEMPDPDKIDFGFRKKVNVGADPVITVRSDFNPLAAFSPVVTTGPDGKAVAEVVMPDNLTRYRIVVLAVAGDKQFGKGESTMTARLPLMIRPSAPRFLNFGDTFKLPIVVQNQTDAPMTVKLALRTANLALTDGSGRSVTVPPNDRVEVQFPAAAALAGTARVQIAGTAGTASDAAEISLPVWTPSTTEAFATYGTIDDGAIAQPVALPGKVVLDYGGLEVTTASTNLQALTDALVYLVRYPFDCAEQRSSRILAIASLRDVLTAFHATDLPSQAAMASSVARDIEQLARQQHDVDGGFHWWSSDGDSDPYLSAYVTHALARAKAKGYAVPAAMLDNAKRYLGAIKHHLQDAGFGGDDPIGIAVEAYALYVRKQLGDADVTTAKELVVRAGGADKLPLDAAGWLLGAFGRSPAAATERAAIVRHAMNRVGETAGAANFKSDYATGGHHLLASDGRVDAVMLDALIGEQPKHDLIPKLVTGLLAHRKRGRWLSTHENAFVLVALERYFRTYEKVTPSFVAKVWLGGDFAGEQAFRGRSTTSQQIAIPMKTVAGHDKSNLTIQKAGAGRLYYRIGMSYAPASLAIEPADHGFVVERKYEAVDDPKDVSRGQDGTWRIKAGARVRVRLVMVIENQRYHVALVDPMPAGFEAMNAALAITGDIPRDPRAKQEPKKRAWWYRTWYEHQNLRDERVEAFAAKVDQGVHEYEYVARATTPGSYIVPPTKAEEMYMPETFGRAASDRVVIE